MHAWLGIVHTLDGRHDEAEAALRAALLVEPDFAWVTDVLLPRLAEARAGG